MVLRLFRKSRVTHCFVKKMIVGYLWLWDDVTSILDKYEMECLRKNFVLASFFFYNWILNDFERISKWLWYKTLKRTLSEPYDSPARYSLRAMLNTQGTGGIRQGGHCHRMVMDNA